MTKKKLTGSIYFKLLIPAILIACVYVYYRVKKHDFLDNGLQSLVEQKTNSLYKISYDSISVDEAGGDLYIKNLYLKGDTARQMEMIRSGDTNASKVIVDIYIPLLKVVDFKTDRALLSKQLQCNEIVINDARAILYVFPGQDKKEEIKQRQELFKQILGNLKLIQAGRVSINNTEVVAKDYFTKEIKFQTFNTTIGLEDVRIDSTYKEDTTRTLFCKEIKVSSDRVRLGEKNNIAEITSLAFDTRSKIVFLSRLEYDAIKNNGFFKSRMEDITVEGIEWKGPAERSDLLIKNVVLKRGEIEILSGKGGKSTSSSKPNEKILTGWIKNFSLDKLLVKSFSLTSTTNDKKKEPIIIEKNFLLLKNIRVDTAAALNKSLVNKIGEAEFSNNELKFISKDKFYTYRISGFKINTKSRKLWIKQVAVIPAFGEAAFAKRSKFQRDRFDVGINNIECNNVDISKLLEGKFYSTSITTRNTTLKVYRDMSYPKTGESKVGAYPQQLLFKLAFPVKVSKFIGYNTYVEYKEKNPKSDSSGRVRFHNANITITNISNLPPKAGEKATVKFTCNFLGAMPLSGSIIFYLNEWQKGTFKTEASIPKSFDARVLNQLTEPMSLVKINTGVMDYFKCNIMADNYVANGTVVMTYHDFKISVLKKKGDEINKNNLVTLLANGIIKNKNKEGEDMRVATVDKKRDVTKSFFNNIWSAIFTGGQQILGIKPNKDKKALP